MTSEVMSEPACGPASFPPTVKPAPATFVSVVGPALDDDHRSGVDRARTDLLYFALGSGSMQVGSLQPTSWLGTPRASLIGVRGGRI